MSTVVTKGVENHEIVSPEQWLKSRKELLRKEKELTRLRDEISRERQELPWEKVEKQYVFDGPNGKESLADLFDGRSQLIIYHFMFGPGWREGCVGCSFLVDHIGGALPHLENHDVSLVVVSRAPLAEIEAFKERMGWNLKWVSSYESDFNFDYQVSFTQQQLASGKVYQNYEMREYGIEETGGTSVFYKSEAGEIFHTYSTYARGGEPMLTTYSYLDITPKGRNETGPYFSLADWVRHHDRYDGNGYVDGTGRYHEKADDSCCHAQESRAS